MNKYLRENWLKLGAIFSATGFFTTGAIFTYINSGVNPFTATVIVSGSTGVAAYLTGQTEVLE